MRKSLYTQITTWIKPVLNHIDTMAIFTQVKRFILRYIDQKGNEQNIRTLAISKHVSFLL